MISIYPNPSTGTVIIEHEAKMQKIVKLRLVSLSGQVVKEWIVDTKTNGSRTTLDVGEFNGLYLLQFTGSGINHTQRVMIIN